MSERTGMTMLQNVSKIELALVSGGRISGEAFAAERLWCSGPTIVYVIRRSG